MHGVCPTRTCGACACGLGRCVSMCRVVCIMYAHRYVHVFVWIKFVCVCRYCALLHVCVYILCTCVQFVSACVGVCVFGEVGSVSFVVEGY